jgi:hypothetical protein
MGIRDFTSSSVSIARMSPVENHEVKLLAGNTHPNVVTDGVISYCIEIRACGSAFV